MKRSMLHCRSCGAVYDADAVFRCACGEPLDLDWTESGIDEDGRDLPSRYGAFFPFEPGEWLSLGEGNTPLVPLSRLAGELGLSSLVVKNESANPTWSFKDRGTAACIAHARALGFTRVGTVSTGNMAASVAAYGAAAGLETVILVKGDLAEEKLAPIAIYGPRLIRVQGAYDGLYAESIRIGAERGIYFMNSDVPFRVAGSRTIAFEIFEQTDGCLPDWVIVPTSAGGNIRGIINGFMDLKAAGLADRIPGFICAQAAGCSPIATAFARSDEHISPFPAPHTIAHAIENPFPPSGNRVLLELRSRTWHALAAPEDEIVRAQADMARSGLFGQPAAAVPLATLRQARAKGIVKEGERVALVFTGSGLKYTAAFASHRLHWEDCGLEELEERLK